MQRAKQYQKRKRYNVKSKLPAIYSRRQYKKRTIASMATTKVRCEFAVYIRSVSGGGTILNASNTNYNSLATEIPGTFSWSALYADYVRYKIYGLGVRVSPVADTTEITDGASNVPIYIAFYPTYQNVTVNVAEILANDDALRVEPQLTTPQTKYWSFPDNYYQNNTGNGLGTWTSTSIVASQPGQLSIACHQPFESFSNFKSLYMMRVCVYILFDYRKT